MKKNNLIKSFSTGLFIVFMLLAPSFAFAQEFEDDVDDEPVAPISTALPAALVIAIGMGYYFVKKQ